MEVWKVIGRLGVKGHMDTWMDALSKGGMEMIG